MRRSFPSIRTRGAVGWTEEGKWWWWGCAWKSTNIPWLRRGHATPRPRNMVQMALEFSSAEKGPQGTKVSMSCYIHVDRTMPWVQRWLLNMHGNRSKQVHVCKDAKTGNSFPDSHNSLNIDSEAQEGPCWLAIPNGEQWGLKKMPERAWKFLSAMWSILLWGSSFNIDLSHFVTWFCHLGHNCLGQRLVPKPNKII